MKTLYIVRGLPGSGKTTLAERIAPIVCSADDYFTDENGRYNFDPRRLRHAHDYCLRKTRKALSAGVDAVAVANTFTQSREAKKYFEAAEDYGYSVFVVECQSQFGSIHNVPEAAVEAMKERWEKEL